MFSTFKLAVTCAALLSTSTAMADGAPTAEVYFDFDSARLEAGTSDRLTDLVEWSRLNPYAKVVVDGHTDSVGSDVYNIGLSARRAASVQSKLIAMGLPADRIYQGIYGENDLRRSTAGSDRRVAIWTTDAPLHLLIEQSLLRASAVVWNRSVTAAELEGPSTTIVALAR
jgi:hypothetical protein